VFLLLFFCNWKGPSDCKTFEQPSNYVDRYNSLVVATQIVVVVWSWVFNLFVK